MVSGEYVGKLVGREGGQVLGLRGGNSLGAPSGGSKGLNSQICWHFSYKSKKVKKRIK